MYLPGYLWGTDQRYWPSLLMTVWPKRLITDLASNWSSAWPMVRRSVRRSTSRNAWFEADQVLSGGHALLSRFGEKVSKSDSIRPRRVSKFSNKSEVKKNSKNEDFDVQEIGWAQTQLKFDKKFVFILFLMMLKNMNFYILYRFEKISTK